MAIISRILIFFSFLFLISLAGLYVFIDRQDIFAKSVDTEIDQFLIIGKSTNLIDGWSITFCWRRYNGPWMLYYLDHESSPWTNAQIHLQADRAIVLKDAREVGYLNLRDGSFYSSNHTQRTPTKIATAADPFDNTTYIYPESKDWGTVWPAAMGKEGGRRNK